MNKTEFKTIKRLLTKLVLTLIFGVLFFNCAKQPNSNFSTDKTEYLAGETIILTNNSDDAVNYKWTLPDGQIITTTNAEFKLDPNMSDGNVTITLESYSKKNKKVSKSTKTIPIFASGQITFRSSSSGYPKSIYVDSVYIGSISKIYNSSIGCEEGSCFTTFVKVGAHYIKGVDAGNYSVGGITISKGDKTTYVL